MIWYFILLVPAMLIPATRAMTTEISVISSDSQLNMPHGSGLVRIIYRNTTEYPWHNAKIEIESSDPLAVSTKPPTIPRCQPADRCVFAILANKLPNTPQKRFPITIKLTSDNHPDLHTMSFQVNPLPQNNQDDKGWMYAGTIKINKQSKLSRALVLGLLSAIPIMLLLSLGMYLKKRARKAKDNQDRKY